MATKKLRLDFSKVEERSGINTAQIPAGLHEVKIAGVEQTEAADTTPMLVFSLVPTAAAFKTRNFPFYCKLQANQMWKLRDLLVAAGVDVPKKAVNIDVEKVVGKLIAAEVQDDNYQGKERSSVQAVYGTDILDDDDTTAANDEDDEAEDEVDDETEADEEDDTEEDEDEAEEPALEDMSLADLRALAKELGIKTVGLKKPALIEAIAEAEEEAEEDEEDADEDELDEDDLGDEELDDDEDEEEEEPEPTPARKRPAAKAKPAAKAAAPAAAKRTVRRR